MSLLQSSWNNFADSGSMASRKDEVVRFFDDIGHTFIKTTDSTGVMYWLDENHSCGINVVQSYTTNVKIQLISKLGTYAEFTVPTTIKTIYYYHMGEDKNAWYVKTSDREITDNTLGSFIAAKSASGKWSIFHNNKMYCENGIIDVQLSALADTNTPFSAMKMPALISNENFESLYKIISATNFFDDNCIVFFDDKPCRIVYAGNGTENNISPCLAFPVSDED